MRVLILGARGLIGNALSSFLRRDHEVVAPGRAELDVTDLARLEEEIRRSDAEWVINGTVIGVDECEKDPALARQINVAAVRTMAQASAASAARFLHFSSNYVFRGDEERIYTEQDRPDPINVYGRTKWEGEQETLAASPRHLVVRTSWVFGPGKDNFLSTVGARLARGERVVAISDTWASTTFVGDLCARLAVIVREERAGLLHVVNEGTLTHADFAEEAARLVKASPHHIARLPESAMQRLARRPRFTPMISSLLPPMRLWREALGDFLSGVTALRGVTCV